MYDNDIGWDWASEYWGVGGYGGVIKKSYKDL
jgi:hypothetical protein